MHTSTPILIKIDGTGCEYFSLCELLDSYKCVGTYKIHFFMLSDLKCIPERTKNSLERAVFLFHCVQSAHDLMRFHKEKVRMQK